jgi:hypothetical protein
MGQTDMRRYHPIFKIKSGQEVSHVHFSFHMCSLAMNIHFAHPFPILSYNFRFLNAISMLGQYHARELSRVERNGTIWRVKGKIPSINCSVMLGGLTAEWFMVESKSKEMKGL